MDIGSYETRQNNKTVDMPLQQIVDKMTGSEPSRMKLTETKDQNSPFKA